MPARHELTNHFSGNEHITAMHSIHVELIHAWIAGVCGAAISEGTKSIYDLSTSFRYSKQYELGQL